MSSILNCIIVDDEPVAREILATYVEKTPNLHLIASYQNALEVIQTTHDENIDIYFLDINMPEITGLSLAKILGNASHIIFTTAYREYAVDGFDLQATDYLLKPISFDRFLQAIQKITIQQKSSTTTHQETNTSNFMFVRADRKMIKVDFKDIFYVESLGDYVKIVTQKETITSRDTISNLEEKLNSDFFLRTHRSFIVNMHQIHSYTNEFIEIENKAIPISRTYKDVVLQKLAQV
ncbi:Chemotaxis protein CheY [Tenacibaculum sp. 190130A14a]|uniref:Two-component system, LytTR family, response regulator n=1 Tax=Tenacibaculum polynesiense TaxID=3137857 RepID=A0ABP1F2Z4_9FLAO